MSNESKPKNPELEDAELQKAKADAIAAEYDLLLKAEELKKKREERRHQKWLNKNSREVEAYNSSLEDFTHGVVKIREAITDFTVDGARQELRALAASQRKPGPIRIEFCSPGGSILSGVDLFDDIRALSARGHFITTVVTGFAASMAGVLVQAGDHRVIGRNGYIHLHEGSSWTAGKLANMKEDVKFTERLTLQMIGIYAERATKAGVPTDAKELAAEVENREIWLNAEEALARGFVDEIQG